MIGNNPKVLLISMPWQNITFPSIQLGILKETIKKQCEIESDVLSAYLIWAEYIYKRWKDVSTVDVIEMLNSIGSDYSYQCVGDWIFTKALYGFEYKKKLCLEYLQRKNISEKVIKIIERLYYDASDYIEYLLRVIAFSEYDVICFTNTFSQTISSLALAKKIKSTHPFITIIMGGANCDKEQGIAIIKHFDCIDYIVSGEGELSLPNLIKKLKKKATNLKDISGLIYRGKGKNICFVPDKMVPECHMVYPEYDEYFQRLDELSIGEYIKPIILIENSKGCWWGNKSHCLFCGINEKRTRFRTMDSNKLIDKILYYSIKYKCGDFYFVDNIMNNSHYTNLLPLLGKNCNDYNFFWEIKANITRENAIKLKNAGVRNIQPGIENFSTDVLKLLRKGVMGIQNIYLLKLAREYSLNVSWNFLYGVPNECDGYYDVDKWYSLFHFEKPISYGKIVLERHSPLYREYIFKKLNRGPAESYSYLYDFSYEDMCSVAYMFESEKCGISGKKITEIKKWIDEWNKNTHSYLYYKRRRHSLEISDSRTNRFYDKYYINEETWKEAYLFLKDIRKFSEILFHLNNQKSYKVSYEELLLWLNKMCSLRYVYNENDRYLSLAIAYNRLLFN